MFEMKKGKVVCFGDKCVFITDDEHNDNKIVKTIKERQKQGDEQ